MSTRQLMAIMFTDIVGYSSLMGRDEEKALDTLKINRDIHRPSLQDNNGELIKELGDGIMASFHSVIDAISAAKQILRDTREKGVYQLRIGIHLGEVLFENNDIFGDGVNIASRLQGIAEPDSIYISEAVNSIIINKKDIETRFVSEMSLKNISTPLKIYYVVMDETLEASTHSKLNGHSSIAVLPFINMSSDREQDYFCDGMAEEIIDTLSQIDNLRVIARTSVFSFKEKNQDVREIGRTLGVTNLLEGSVRKTANRVRITTKLIKVEDGSNIWSNKYDRELEDIFAIQEDIATNVATELKGFLTKEEKEVVKPHETDVLAYEYYLKGKNHFNQANLQSAMKMFRMSIEIDPLYAPAYSALSMTHSWAFQWEGDRAKNLEMAQKNSAIALKLAPKMAESLTAHAFSLDLAKKYDEAQVYYDKAIAINPKNFDAYYHCARMNFALGYNQKAIQYFKKAAEVREEDFQSLSLLCQCYEAMGTPIDPNLIEEERLRIEKHLSLQPEDRRALSLGGVWMYTFSNKARGLELMEKALELYPDESGTLFNGACLYSRAGQTERALDLLEKAINKGFGYKEWIDNDPDYDNLRNLPRFKELMHQLEQR